MGILLFACIGALHLYPEPLFAHRTDSGNLSLFCDTPFSNPKALDLLAETQTRLSSSPIYDRGHHYRIFVCNGSWRRKLFFLPVPSARGVAYLGSTAVFICDGDICRNCIRRTDGRPNMTAPNLAYYAAHEITHVCTEKVTGPIDYLLLPNWIREGYADYVGRGSLLQDPAMREAFLRNAPAMNFPAIAPYLRYNLLIAHYLETEKWTPKQLFKVAPKQKEAEAELRQALKE